jgi:hypothetical protein
VDGPVWGSGIRLLGENRGFRSGISEPKEDFSFSIISLFLSEGGYRDYDGS